MPLTAIAINAAKPRPKPYKLADGRGLYLLVTPTGGRLWRMNYRFDGTQKTISFGNYPDLSLAKARDMLATARESLAEGNDPMEVRRQKARAEKARTADTFQAISEEWLQKIELAGRSKSTITGCRNRS